MAIRSDITPAHLWFIGERKQLQFELVDDAGNPVDPTGWALQWALRLHAQDADPALITKTTGTGIAFTGAYNASRSANTQRIVVTLGAADAAALRAKTYKHALKRTDAGSEAVLAYGDAVLQAAATH